MKKFDHQKIEKVIGYQFNNAKLLKQAFFRSSYAHENGCESNEVLEFIGDKVLDLAVIRILLERYSTSNVGVDYFKSSKQEGELTKIKSQLVNTDYLVKSFDALGIEEYIYYGKNDLNNKVTDVKSVKEDVFEAIIGAIALDSKWNMDKVIKIVKKLLNTDKFFKEKEVDTNYVGQLQELVDIYGYKTPQYALELINENGVMLWHAILHVNGLKGVTEGFGPKQKDAKKDAAKKMIVEIKGHQQKLEKKKTKPVNNNDVFAIINSLVQAGEIEKPIYEFEETYDDDGNPCWKCDTHIPGFRYFYYGYGSSKKEAQKESLIVVLENIEEEVHHALFVF